MRRKRSAGKKRARTKPPKKLAPRPKPHSRPPKEKSPFSEVRPPLRHTELPYSYGETKLVLLARDPYWGYAYWDFSGETWNWIQRKSSEDSSLKPMLRVEDLDLKRSYDLLISLETKNWYLHLGLPDHRYVAELGLGSGNNRFYLIARSNEIRTPRDSPSEEVDSEWNDREFEEIYRLSGGGGLGSSSPSSPSSRLI